MATPSPHIKTHAAVRLTNGVTSHRRLVDQAQDHLADQIRIQNPDISWPRAIAQATQRLAEELGVGRAAIYAMRQRDAVPGKHWPAFERLTAGKMTVSDFEQAAG